MKTPSFSKIELAIPAYWSPEEALAVFDLIDPSGQNLGPLRPPAAGPDQRATPDQTARSARPCPARPAVLSIPDHQTNEGPVKRVLVLAPCTFFARFTRIYTAANNVEPFRRAIKAGDVLAPSEYVQGKPVWRVVDLERRYGAGFADGPQVSERDVLAAIEAVG